jgi:hypothetical protein
MNGIGKGGGRNGYDEPHPFYFFVCRCDECDINTTIALRLNLPTSQNQASYQTHIHKADFLGVVV